MPEHKPKLKIEKVKEKAENLSLSCPGPSRCMVAGCPHEIEWVNGKPLHIVRERDGRWLYVCRSCWEWHNTETRRSLWFELFGWIVVPLVVLSLLIGIIYQLYR